MRKGMIFVSLLALGAVAWLQTPSASLPEAETFQVDSTHTSVVFRILHLNIAPFYGRFNTAKGSFTVQEGGTGSVDITIDATSVDTADEKRNGHLKSPDFFSVEQFPEITFKGSLKHVSGDKFEATGTLTLHGVSKEITVPMERFGSANAMGGHRVGFGGSFTVRRSEYGMNWNPGVLGDEVTLLLGIEGLNKG